MPTEVFYYSPPTGSSSVQDLLVRLDTKALARTLSQIDLLEGDDLPDELDQEMPGTPARLLNVRSGRGRLIFAYLRRADHAIVIDASDGKSGKLRRSLAESLCPVIDELESHESGALDLLKSHREFVAETTLNDPTLAAAYSRAREHAQFALSLVKLRKSAGLTPTALAERTGLTEARIDSIERGRIPKIASLRRLVDALQARIVIAPGTGITIEPFQEPKRSLRPKRTLVPVAVSVQSDNGANTTTN